MEIINLDESEILKKIQEVEAEVEELTRQAVSESEKKLNKTKEEADHLFREMRDKIEAECARWVENEKLKARKEADSILSAAKKEAQDLMKRVQLRMEEGVKHVLRSVYPDHPGNFFE